MIHRINESIPMNELPTWLQELWELDSALARRAEKHYLELKQANESSTKETPALPIDGVMPRSLMQEQLHLKTGSRTLNVRGVKNMDMPHVIISCVECWEPDSDDGFGEAEIDDASYYLTSAEIDKLIDKLREGKAFLNGA